MPHILVLTLGSRSL